MLLSHSDNFARWTSRTGSSARRGHHPGLEHCTEPRSQRRRLHRPRTDPRPGLRRQPRAQIVVTGQDTVAMINHQAEATFGLSARHRAAAAGSGGFLRPVELRAYLEQAKASAGRRRSRTSSGSARAGYRLFEIHVNPLVDAENGLVGVSVVFFDVTATGCWSTRWCRPTANSRLPTRSCSRPTRNSRPPTKNSVDRRGTRDHQRGTPVHQRRTRDDERGVAVDQRRTAQHQRHAA